MWIHIPSTFCPSAPALARSTSGLKSLGQAFAQSVTWRGKPSLARLWSARLKTVSWLTHLSGQILPPSKAALGAERWIASLVESHASLIRSRESVPDPMTNGTAGPMPGARLFNPAHGSCSLKTSEASFRPAAKIKSAAAKGSNVTWSGWVSMWRGDYSARQKSAARMNASACSSWPSPAARDWKDTDGMAATGINPDGSERQRADQLARSVFLWATPKTMTGGANSKREERGSGGQNLQEQVMKGRWSTPRVSTGDYTRDHGVTGQERLSLQGEAKTWPTPTAEPYGRNQSPSENAAIRPSLAMMAPRWSTPTTADVEGGRKARSKGRSEELLLNGQAEECSRQALQKLTDGDPSLNATRSLNPAFVEWLMGWPPGWASLALTDCVCLEMELCHWRVLMRGELYRLGLPPAASPVQPSFI